MKLTEEQQHILNNCERNIYISAAPGSGKSTMLSHIADKLLRDPHNYVLLVTFTNKAARSIISKCVNVDQARIMGGTFHGLANLLIKRNGFQWNICDEGKKRLIIKKVFECQKDKEVFNIVLEQISNDKSEWPYTPSDCTQKYNNELRKYNLVDFDDMIYRFIDYCSQLHFPKITHILVDELQDTSGPQLEMLKRLQDKLKCNMIGVADDDQAIYAWRGARPQNVRDFINVFGCSILNMGYNFRSAKRIVECSSKLILNNKSRIEKVIKPAKTEEGYISEYQAPSIFTEIDYAVIKCKQNTSKNIAILYRNRTYKNHLEFELRKAGLKYCINDALELTDRSAIKVMLSCMRLAAMIGDTYDLEIASKGLQGIGKTTVDNIKKQIKDQDFNQILREKFQDIKQVKRLSSVLDIVNWFNLNKDCSLDMLARHIETKFTKSFDYQADMRSFILDITKGYKTRISDIRDLCNDLGLDGKEEHNDEDATIELSTIHGYKGLEKDIVIMPWTQMFLDDSAFKDTNIEDERRLFYVGVTRAKEKLYLTYSGKQPRFIREMRI